MQRAPAWISSMWRSVTSSDESEVVRGAPRSLAVVFPALLSVAVAAFPAGLISIDEALAAAFPAASHDRETVFLTDDELEHVHEAAGHRPQSAMVTRFRVYSGSETVGWAYLDTHRVRTLPETVMVIIAPSGSIERVEVVAFREPLDYLPPDSWYRQFDGRELSDDLELKRSIRPITGATLTARATTDAVRRVLAIHASITGRERLN